MIDKQKRSPLQANETGLSATNIARKYQKAQPHYGSSLEAILKRLKGVRRSGNCWIAFCPSHLDRHHHSLSVAEGDDGKVLMFCFTGCLLSEIVAALGLTVSDLFPKK